MNKSPYYSLEVEEAFIGSLLLDGELIKECTIIPEQLYVQRLKTIFTFMVSLAKKGKPIDMVSVAEEAGNELFQLGGGSYLVAISGSVPSTANFHYYEETVKEYFRKRKTVEIAHRIKQEAEEGDIEIILRDGISHLQQVEDHGAVPDQGDIKNGLIDLYQECEKDLGDLGGIPSGFTMLDQLTGGFQESDLVVIGARPSVGKTAFALNLALQAAKDDVSIIFSLEMAKKQLLKRAVSQVGEVSSVKIRNPYRLFEEQDWNQLHKAMATLSELNLHIFDQGGMDVSFIHSNVRKLRRKYGEEKRILVLIDYLQLIQGDSRLRGNRVAEISEISRALKQMAKELNVVVIALSQLSRAVENRQDKRPMLSDLRDSGQIEQDSDLIAFLYRDDYYDQQSKEKDRIEIILAKQRNGPVGTVHLRFQKEFGRFEEWVG
ncbi:replicative DNA helicase [Bacillus tuaregi]|uniref:replicative DNA helicase n=1 Tax=Bacillus tuaregi TaxID=1816695 RepID=UPI0008F8F129|nr:replicative DNA helicase [Bacillus tuaregi]